MEIAEASAPAPELEAMIKADDGKQLRKTIPIKDEISDTAVQPT